MRKIDRRLEGFADVDMLSRLVAIIDCHGFDLFFIRTQYVNQGLGDDLTLLGGQSSDTGPTTFALDDRQQGTAALTAQHQISFPIADPTFIVDDRGALIDRNTLSYLYMRWIGESDASLNVAEVAYASFHRPVDPRADIDRFAHEKAKRAGSVVAHRRSARGSIVAAICSRPIADSASSTWSDRAIEDGAAEMVDEPPEHSNRSGFYFDEARKKPLRHAPQPNLRWLIGYNLLFSRRIFHIFEARSTGDIPSYAPPRGGIGLFRDQPGRQVSFKR
jgi:hypothetical protein